MNSLPLLAAFAALAGAVGSQSSYLEYRGRYDIPAARSDVLLGVVDAGNGRLLACGDQGVLLLDRAALLAGRAAEIASLTGLNARDVYLAPSGTHAFVNLHRTSPASEAGFAVLRLAGNTLQLVAMRTEPSLLYEKMCVAGDHLYVAAHDAGLRVYDVSNPAAPTLSGALTAGFVDAFAVAVDGARAYVADGAGGLKIVDVSTPSQPLLIAGETVETALGVAQDVATRDGEVYVATGTSGVAAYVAPRLDSRVAHRVVGSAESLAWLGDHLVVGSLSGVTVFGRSAGAVLTPLGHERIQRRGKAVTPRICHGVGSDGRFVYAADWSCVDVFELVPAATAAAPDVQCDTVRIRFAAGGGTQPIQVWNDGAAPLTLSAVESTDPAFAVAWSAGAIAPGAGTVIEVTFRGGPGSGTVLITTDDPDESPLPIQVFGATTALDPGEVAPDFTLPSYRRDPTSGQCVRNGTFALSARRGQVVWFPVDATWSPGALPVLADVQRSVTAAFQHHPGVLTALLDEGGSQGETEAWVTQHWSTNRLGGALWFDSTGGVASTYHQPSSGLPTGGSVVVDARGRVALALDDLRARDVIQRVCDLVDDRFADPSPPANGFPLREVLDRELAYSDGYRTRVDIRFPEPARAPPPPTGWPGVLLVHGLRGDRKSMGAAATALAAHGYLAIAYDVRGQGDTRALNTSGGTEFVGPAEKSDMAELLWGVHDEFGRWLDFDRLAVSGGSQGGLHARAAAALSGRALPRPRGNVTRFPELNAIVSGSAIAPIPDLFGRDGKVFRPRGLAPFVAPGSRLQVDPQAAQAVIGAFQQQDFAGFAAWQQRMGYDDSEAFSQTDVPVLCMTSWNDHWTHPNPLVDLLATLPTTTPRHLHIETGDHDSPPTLLDRVARENLELRWLDRFLKGSDDELPEQPTFHLAVIPDDTATYLSYLGIWQHRRSAAWPRTGRTTTRELWFGRGGVLADVAPAAAEPPDRVTHAVAAGFGPAAWLATSNQTAAVFGQLPLSQVVYRSAPLAADCELLGRAVVTVELTSSAPNLQVGVALLDEDPSGAQRYVTGGFRAERGRAPGRATCAIELGDCCSILRRGHRIVVAVENHAWHRPPGQSELRTVPYFESYTFDVEHSVGRASKIALPILPEPDLGCRAAIQRVPRAAGGTVLIALDGSATRAGHTYATLMSISGTVPGTNLAGAHLPLNVDPLTELGLLAAGTPVVPGFVGTLDPAGRAFAGVLATPNLIPIEWIGLQLSFNAVTIGPSGFSIAHSSQVRVDH